MALQDISLPRLDGMTQLVDVRGVSSITFSQWWDTVAGQLEAGINGINEALNAAAAAQSTADTGLANAATAQSTANTGVANAAAAQTTADGATADAATAQATANAAGALAATKVTKDVGASWSAPSGTASRSALASYSAPVAAAAYDVAQMQAVMDAMQATSHAAVAIVTDLRGNHALTP